MSLLGWGKTSDLDIDDRSEVLLEVELPVVTHEQCKTSMNKILKLSMNSDDLDIICAGGEAGKDTCEV